MSVKSSLSIVQNILRHLICERKEYGKVGINSKKKNEKIYFGYIFVRSSNALRKRRPRV